MTIHKFTREGNQVKAPDLLLPLITLRDVTLESHNSDTLSSPKQLHQHHIDQSREVIIYLFFFSYWATSPYSRKARGSTPGLVRVVSLQELKLSKNKHLWLTGHSR